MKIFTKEWWARAVPVFYAVVAVLAVVTLFALVWLQAYVRWTINQNFTFLGGGELEVFTASAFAFVLGMHIFRAKE